ncbi:MAG: hypothetical protein K5856_06115 [Bacteroidaceae bacterium]|nr:hypothetical protein [Bacteroidaceae bacterium]
MINLQHVINIDDLISQILSEAQKVMGKNYGLSTSEDSLAEVFSLLENIALLKPGFTIVFKNFQVIKELDSNIVMKISRIIKNQTKTCYIVMGNQEADMKAIFEKKKAPFYYIGEVLRLGKISHEELSNYISNKFLSVAGVQSSREITTKILETTNCHPYYTMLLAANVWQILVNQGLIKNVTELAIEETINQQDLNYERIWVSFNRTDRRVLQTICQHKKIFEDKSFPTSTTFSAVKRLMQAGYIIKTEEYQLEDPFFELWILRHRIFIIDSNVESL